LCQDLEKVFYINVFANRLLFRHQVPGGGGGGPPGAPGQPGGGPPPHFKLNIVESIERIKEEFNFLQAQYHK
jgi:hypothetical protein